MMKGLDTNYLLDIMVSMTITNYNLSALDMFCDMSCQFKELIKELKARGVTLAQIESKIIQNDFTHMLTTCGSGNRERSFVMDMLKEYYN